MNRRKFIQAGSLLSLPLVLSPEFLFADSQKIAGTELNYSKNPHWMLLSKVTYWPKEKELQKLKKSGFKTYIQEQLNAPREDNDEVQTRIKELKLDIKYEYNDYTVDEKRTITYLDKDLTYCRKEFEKTKDRGWHEWIRPGMEVVSANWIRAVYSPWQLREMMVEFWHNHFNVTINANMEMGSCMPAYDRDVIRKNVFGNFRALLEDVAKSPAMLYYLNNKSSQASPANENYARELFELHTLGQEHYLNHLYDKWRDVPGAWEGNPIGYIDEDVYETARAFTGWTIADGTVHWRSGVKEEFPNTGEFYYFDGWHDSYQKRVLGNELKSNMPAMYDGKKVLDLLASHPGTAKHICRKILIRFMGENFPETLLNKAKSTWLKNVASADQIQKTLQTIFESEEFQNHKVQKVKRPYEYMVSAARATDAEFTPNTALHWITSTMGYKPFMWPAPTGHPDKDSYWMGPGAMLARWRVTNTIMYWKGFGVFKFDFNGHTPSSLTYGGIVDFWSEKITGSKLQEKYRNQVIKIIAADNSPESIPIIPAAEMENKLIMLAQFLIATPDFQIR
jgi:uncharacterized protein (DUF1800 family)